jgi:uncharacterized phage protein gp47/JayE
MSLIPSPDLDIRDEVQFAAETIARVSGGLTVERIDSQMARLQQARLQLLSGVIPPAICAELTNANPSSPHVVILEAVSWQLAQMAYRINQLPERDSIAFANLFIERRDAQPATSTLEFAISPTALESVTIPIGTWVGAEVDSFSPASEQVIFETTDAVTITPGETGTAPARRTVGGETQLAANILTNLISPISDVVGVTNPDLVDSGANAETTEEALARARNYQRRGGRLVSKRDIEDAILEEVLYGNGIVKAFPFIVAGDWESYRAGHTTIIVMTKAGNAVSPEVKTAIQALLTQAIGNQFFYLLDPMYEDFSVMASIKIAGLTSQVAIIAAVEKNLRDFYAARVGNFGRRISRSEIITVIEGTQGVDRIASNESGPILSSPAADVVLAPYQLPRLLNVILSVVPA